MKRLYVIVFLIFAVYIAAISTTFSYTTVHSDIGSSIVESSYVPRETALAAAEDTETAEAAEEAAEYAEDQAPEEPGKTGSASADDDTRDPDPQDPAPENPEKQGMDEAEHGGSDAEETQHDGDSEAGAYFRSDPLSSDDKPGSENESEPEVPRLEKSAGMPGMGAGSATDKLPFVASALEMHDAE